MVTRKDLIIAVLATFCLTAMIFMVIPIRSSINPYDPWLDYNEDGKISLQDLILLANSYGTTGDPTKDVTITSLNHYSSEENVAVQPPAGQSSGTYRYFSIEGFRQVSLYVGALNSTSHSLWIQMGSYNNKTGEAYYQTFSEIIPTITGTTFATAYIETFAVQGPELRVVIWPGFGQTSPEWVALAVYVTC
jgi:hypothetical protein